MFNNGYNQQPKNVLIKRVVLIPTKHTYNDVYQRSFGLSANVKDLNNMEEFFVMNGVNNNTPVNNFQIASNLPDIIKLNTNPIGRVDIVNGWGTQRLRFIIEVESKTPMGDMVSYIQGYSEYYDPSISGYIDPNMLFHINSITNVTRFIDPIRGSLNVTPHSTYNVVTDLAGGSSYTEIDPMTDLKLIRPKDVIDNLSTLDLYGDNSDIVMNSTGSIGGRTNTSARDNNDPVTYFTKTMNAFLSSRAQAPRISDSAGILQSASYITAERPLATLPFIMELTAITNSMTIPTSFTMNILNIMDGMIQAKTTLIDQRNDVGLANYANILDTENTCAMLQPTIENMTAAAIAQSMSSILTDCLLSSISVSFSNTGGQVFVIPTGADSFIEGINTTMYVNKAVAAITHVLMPSITKNNMLLVEAYVNASLLGDTTVAVGINHGPLIPFRYPTFTDSLYVPVIADNVSKTGFINDFQNIIEATYTGADHH